MEKVTELKYKIGGNYISDGTNFVLFDVMINDNYLSRENVQDIANSLNLTVVPTITIGKLQDGINWVKSKPKSKIGIADSEGLVERPLIELKDRYGNRIIVKIKVRDFE